MERIKCTIDHITYQNQENGYAVLQAIVRGFRDKQTTDGVIITRTCTAGNNVIGA